MNRTISDGGLAVIVLAAGVPGAVAVLVFGQVAAVAVTVVVLGVAFWVARGRRVLPAQVESRPIEPWRS